MASFTPPPTQPGTQFGGKSSTVYRWVILFLYCEDTEFPFSCVPLTALENSNFPFSVGWLLFKIQIFVFFCFVFFLKKNCEFRLLMVLWMLSCANNQLRFRALRGENAIAFSLKLKKVFITFISLLVIYFKIFRGCNLCLSYRGEQRTAKYWN